ncbi:MAG: UDP-2,3-diacylglucosamine hydrolase [Gammaproteobacteria bacterium]|jgi:UDP-2,3-diacylglucosamine hydrolase
MPEDIVFLSDCHLDASKPAIQLNLLDLLGSLEGKINSLYLLGDLFEVWLGDDDPAEYFQPILEAIKAISQNGAAVFFMAGNRDFLVGSKLSNRWGFSILEEPHILELSGQKIGLMHGDNLCIDDIDYQNFRKQVRNPDWQNWFCDKPLEERQAIAAKLRSDSHKAMQQKAEVIMDVNRQAVLDAFDNDDLSIIIHGHTHRPAFHHYDHNRTRIVLGDWNPEPSYLRWNAQSGFNLVDTRVKDGGLSNDVSLG